MNAEKKEAEIIIPRDLAKKIYRYTNHPDLDCYLDEDETIVKTAKFDDGFTADIKCCGVQWEDSGNNCAWTEGILYDAEGKQVACTEPDDNFFGVWMFYDDPERHTVYVKIAEEAA